MRRILTIPILLLLLILVSLSILPSITLLKEARAVTVRPTLPLQTTITSAVDGNNAPVQNGGYTLSNFILFTFTTSGGAPPYRYICTLDLLIFKCDTAPPTVSRNLLSGQHTFSVQTFDEKNVDQKTPVFSWIVGPRPTLLTMQINGNPTPPWVIIAGKPFIVAGILTTKPPNPYPLAGQTVVFGCGCSPVIKDSTTTLKDGSYTFSLTAPNQGSYKAGVTTTFDAHSPYENSNAGGILNVKPGVCTSPSCK
jgi:hypothetical protein